MKRSALWLSLFPHPFQREPFAYRVFQLGYPVVPTVSGETWRLSVDGLDSTRRNRDPACSCPSVRVSGVEHRRGNVFLRGNEPEHP